MRSSKVKKAERLLGILQADIDANPINYEGHKLYNIYRDLTGFLANYDFEKSPSSASWPSSFTTDDIPLYRKKHLEKDYDTNEFNMLIRKCRKHLQDPEVLKPIPPLKITDLHTGVTREERTSQIVLERLIHLLELHLYKLKRKRCAHNTSKRRN